MSVQKEFEIGYRAARLRRGCTSAAGVFIRAGHVTREEIEPRRTYWAVLSQNMDRISRGHGATSKEDRLFYVRRARAMRRASYRDNWAGC